MAEPVREHLANIQIICREDLAMGNTIGPGAGLPLPPTSTGDDGQLARDPDETDEAYIRRVRVTNYLSLAQEFAALKKADARALPFGLSPPPPPTSDSSDEDPTSEGEDSTSVPSENPPPPSSDRPVVPDVVPKRNSRSTTSDVDRRLPTEHSAPSPKRPQPSAPVAGGRPGAGGRGRDRPDSSTAATTTADDFDVYTIETALPHVEWERLERQLRQSADDERKRRVGGVWVC